MTGGPKIEAHIEPDEVEAVLNAPDHDPRRQHLLACTRCQVLLESYQGFLVKSDTDNETSETLIRRLEVAIEAESPGAGSAAPRVVAVQPAFRERLRSALSSMGARPILAAAAILLVVGTVIVSQQLRPDDHEVQLRQDKQPGAPAGGHAVEWLTPKRQPDGSLELAWKPLSGADAYEVHLYSPNLDEVARFGPMTSPHFLLAPGNAALATAPDTLIARVIALRESDPVGESSLTTIGWR